MAIDFGRTAKDYAWHRAGFPDRFFDRLMARMFPDEPMAVPHRVWVLTARAP